MPFRADTSKIRLDGIRKTSQGGIVAPAYLTRTGVFIYDTAQGQTRELRTPEEVFKADSLASLEDAPITTDVHPERVTGDNWKALNVGYVKDTPRKDGDFVAANVRINDGPTVTRIDNKELSEFSCGYSCDVVKKDGEYQGLKYDHIQTNIQYNHVTLGGTNWGRAGSEVKLRLDGEASPYLVGHYAENEVSISEPINSRKDSSLMATEKTPAEKLAELEAENAKLKADKAQVDAKVKADADAAAKLKADADAKAVTDKLAALEAENAQLKADAITNAQKSVQAAIPTAGTAVVAVKTDAIDDARKDASYRDKNAWRGPEWLRLNPRKKA